MNKEVIYINDSDREEAFCPKPMNFAEFVSSSPYWDDKVEEYVRYRIDFKEKIKNLQLENNVETKNFEKIVYLGKSYHNDDTFACFDNNTWILLFGKLNSGFY